jgi:Ca2+/H+ antiporter
VVKLASTSWRMVNYYLRAPAYARRGPPATLARVLGPFLSLACVLVPVSGLALLLGPSSIHQTALQIHKVAFYLAPLLIVAHVAMHLPQAVRLVALDRVKHRGAALLVRARWMSILGSVLLGALLALALAVHAEPYLHHYYGQ